MGDGGRPNSGGTRCFSAISEQSSDAPFVGEISRDSDQKGGGLVMRTGALDGNHRTGRTTASAPARPPALHQQAAHQSTTAEAAAHLPCADWSPPDRRRNPPEIGEAQALLLISGHEAWPRGGEVDGGRFCESRRGWTLGRAGPGAGAVALFGGSWRLCPSAERDRGTHAKEAVKGLHIQ